MSGDFSKTAFVLYHLVIILEVEDMLARSARKSSEGTAVLSFRLYVRAKLLALSALGSGDHAVEVNLMSGPGSNNGPRAHVCHWICHSENKPAVGGEHMGKVILQECDDFCITITTKGCH